MNTVIETDDVMFHVKPTMKELTREDASGNVAVPAALTTFASQLAAAAVASENEQAAMARAAAALGGIVCIAGIEIPARQGRVSAASAIVDTPTARRNLKRLATAVASARWNPTRGAPILLEGPSGAGKTVTLRHVAGVLGFGADILELHLDDALDSRALLGGYAVTDVPGEFSWRPGPITSAVISGRWVVIEDIDRAPFEVLAALASLTMDRRLMLPGRDGTIEAHRDFMLFATRSVASLRVDTSVDVVTATDMGTDEQFLENADDSMCVRQLLEPLHGPLGAFGHHWLRVPILPLGATLITRGVRASNQLTELEIVLRHRHPLLPNHVVSIMLTSYAVLSVAHGVTQLANLSGEFVVPEANLLPPGMAHLARFGRALSPRDLFKWAARVERLTDIAVRAATNKATAAAAGPTTSNLMPAFFVPDRDKEAVVTEAVSVFAHHIPLRSLRLDIAVALARLWGLGALAAPKLAGLAGKPDVERSLGGALRIGRTVLSASPTLVAAPVLPRFFAPTRHGLSLLDRIAACVALREPTLLVGETGNGKTTGVQALAASVGITLTVINLNMQTDSADLLGGFKPMYLKQLAAPLVAAFSPLFVRTFSETSNAAFISAVTSAASACQWARLSRGMSRAASLAAQRLVRDSAVGHAPLTEHSMRGLRDEWAAFAAQLAIFERQRLLVEGTASTTAHGDNDETRTAMASTTPSAFAFAFVEGALTTAVRRGHWVLLDEINLASPETLQRLAGLLDGGVAGGSLTLTERFDVDAIATHSGFRLFAAMNPATDAGKRDLPPALRSRFTEIYVDEIDSVDDLRIIVGQCTAHMSGGVDGISATVLDAIVSFYTEARVLSASRTGVLRDGSGVPPHYSVRSLTRALKITSDLLSAGYPLRAALAEGLTMSFIVQLDVSSSDRLSAVLRRSLSATGLASTSAMNSGSDSGHDSLVLRGGPRDMSTHVLVNTCWLPRGPLEPLDQTLSSASSGPRYVLVPSVARHVHNLARAALVGRFPVLLQGPTSSGKTSMVEYLAARVGRRCMRINNHEHTDLAEYLGTYVSEPGSGRLVFADGLLVTALRTGAWLILDELNLAPSEVLEALNRLLDDNRELFVPETQEVIRPHPAFMLFATQNPAGLYGGRKQLSLAFRNRFIELHVDDIPESELETILARRAGLPPSFVTAMVGISTELHRMRQASNVFAGAHSYVTTRDLLRWGARRPDSYQALAESGYMLLAERLRVDSEKDVVRSVLERHCRCSVSTEAMYNAAWVVPSSKFDSGECSTSTQVGAKRPLSTVRMPSAHGIQSTTGGNKRRRVPDERTISEEWPVWDMRTFDNALAARLRQFMRCATTAEQTRQTADATELGEPNDVIDDALEYGSGELLPIQGTDGLTTVSLTASLRRLYTLVGRCIAADEPVLLVGETGCGKTTVVQLFALLLQQPLHVVNCHAHTETADFVGSLRPNGDKSVLRSRFADAVEKYLEVTKSFAPSASTNLAEILDGKRATTSAMNLLLQVHEAALSECSVLGDNSGMLQNSFDAVSRAHDACNALFTWVDGPLVTAMRHGDFILLDEAALAEDAVLERLNSVLEPARTLTLAEKGELGAAQEALLVRADPKFRFFATMNPGGDFGKRELSPALRNRFTEIWLPAIDSETDLRLIVSDRAAALALQHRISPPTLASSFVEALVRFVVWFDTHASSGQFVASPTTTRRPKTLRVTLRDVHAWLSFLTVVADETSFNAWERYAHGACLILLDGLGLGSGMSNAALRVIQRAAKSFIVEQAPPAARPGVEAVLSGNVPSTIITTSEAFGIPPFLIPKGPVSTASPTAFSLDAPTTTSNLFRILRALQLPKPILLEGSPGVGKSSLVDALATAAGYPLVRINLSEQTDLSDLFGQDLPSNNTEPGGPSFAWCDGAFLRALRAGHWVLLDELNLASQSVLEGLNAALDHRAAVYIPELDRSFTCAPGFRVFATQNPVAQGGGRKGLPKSFLNRFTKVYVEALGLLDQLSITRVRFPTLNVPLCKVMPAVEDASAGLLETMIAFNDAVRRDTSTSAQLGDAGDARMPLYGVIGAPWDVNLRDLFRWCELLSNALPADGFSEQRLRVDPQTGIATVYAQRLRTSCDRAAVASRATLVFAGAGATAVPLIVDAHSSPALRVSRFAVVLDDIALPRSLVPGLWRPHDELTELLKGVPAPLHALAVTLDGLRSGSAVNMSLLSGCGHLAATAGTARVQYHIGVCVSRNWPVLLVGSAASGKTAALRSLAALVGATLREMTVSSSTDATEILGCYEQSDSARRLQKAREAVALLAHGAIQAVQLAAVPPDAIMQQRIEELRAAVSTATSATSAVKLAAVAALNLAVDKAASMTLDVLAASGADSNAAMPIIDSVRLAVAAASKEASTRGQFEWVDGALVTALTRGEWLVLDNVNFCPPAVVDRLNALLEPGGHLLLAEAGVDARGELRQLRPHPAFRLFLTMDAERGAVSRALRNRCLEIFVPSPPTVDASQPGDAPDELYAPQLTMAADYQSRSCSHGVANGLPPALHAAFISSAAQARALSPAAAVADLIRVAHAAGIVGTSAPSSMLAILRDDARANALVTRRDRSENHSDYTLLKWRRWADATVAFLRSTPLQSGVEDFMSNDCTSHVFRAVHTAYTLFQSRTAPPPTRSVHVDEAMSSWPLVVTITGGVGYGPALDSPSSVVAGAVADAAVLNFLVQACNDAATMARLCVDEQAARRVGKLAELILRRAPADASDIDVRGRIVLSIVGAAAAAAATVQCLSAPSGAHAFDRAYARCSAIRRVISEAPLLDAQAPTSMIGRLGPAIPADPALWGAAVQAAIRSMHNSNDALLLLRRCNARHVELSMVADAAELALELHAAFTRLSDALRANAAGASPLAFARVPVALVTAFIAGDAPSLGLPARVLAEALPSPAFTYIYTAATALHRLLRDSYKEAASAHPAAALSDAVDADIPAISELSRLACSTIRELYHVPATLRLATTGRMWEDGRLGISANNSHLGVTSAIVITASDVAIVRFQQCVKTFVATSASLHAMSSAAGTEQAAALARVWQLITVADQRIRGDSDDQEPLALALDTTTLALDTTRVTAAYELARRTKDTLWNYGGHPSLPSTIELSDLRRKLLEFGAVVQRRETGGVPYQFKHKRLLLEALATFVWAVDVASIDVVGQKENQNTGAKDRTNFSDNMISLLGAFAIERGGLGDGCENISVAADTVTPIADDIEAASRSEEARLITAIGVSDTNGAARRASARLGTARAAVEMWCLGEERALHAIIVPVYAVAAVGNALTAVCSDPCEESERDCIGVTRIALWASWRRAMEQLQQLRPRLRTWLEIAISGTAWSLADLQPYQSILWAIEAGMARPRLEDDVQSEEERSMRLIFASLHAAHDAMLLTWHTRIGAAVDTASATAVAQSPPSRSIAVPIDLSLQTRLSLLLRGARVARTALAAVVEPSAKLQRLSDHLEEAPSLLALEEAVYRVVLISGHLTARGVVTASGQLTLLQGLLSTERRVWRGTAASTFASFLSTIPSRQNRAIIAMALLDVANGDRAHSNLTVMLSQTTDVRLSRILSTANSPGHAVLTSLASLCGHVSSEVEAPLLDSVTECAYDWVMLQAMRLQLLIPSLPVDPCLVPHIKARVAAEAYSDLEDERYATLRALLVWQGSDGRCEPDVLSGASSTPGIVGSPLLHELNIQGAALLRRVDSFRARLVVRPTDNEAKIPHFSVLFHELHDFVRSLCGVDTLRAVVRCGYAPDADAVARATLWCDSAASFSARIRHEFGSAYHDVLAPTLHAVEGLRFAVALARDAAIVAAAPRHDARYDPAALIRLAPTVDGLDLGRLADSAVSTRAERAAFRLAVLSAASHMARNTQHTRKSRSLAPLVYIAARFALTHELLEAASVTATASGRGVHTHADTEEGLKQEVAFRAEFPDYSSLHFAGVLGTAGGGPLVGLDAASDDAFHARKAAESTAAKEAAVSAEHRGDSAQNLMDPLEVACAYLAGMLGNAEFISGAGANSNDKRHSVSALHSPVGGTRSAVVSAVLDARDVAIRDALDDVIYHDASDAQSPILVQHAACAAIASLALSRVAALLRPPHVVQQPFSTTGGLPRLGARIYNFFRDENVGEASVCVRPLRNLAHRIVQLLNRFPANELLLLLLRLIHALLRLPATTPIGALLTGATLLLGRAQEWETNAAAFVSLSAQLAPISALVTRWRRLELSCWRLALAVAAQDAERAAAELWLRWFGVLHATSTTEDAASALSSANRYRSWIAALSVGPLIESGTVASQSSSALSSLRREEAFETADRFLRSSTLGTFRFRLTLVAAASRDFSARACIDPRHDVVAAVLWNVHAYYAQFSTTVSRALATAMGPVMRSLSEQVTLHRWDGQSYYALAESAEKGHRIVHRAVLTYRDVLNAPVAPVLDAAHAVQVKDPSPLPPTQSAEVTGLAVRDALTQSSVVVDAASLNAFGQSEYARRLPSLVLRMRHFLIGDGAPSAVVGAGSARRRVACAVGLRADGAALLARWEIVRDPTAWKTAKRKALVDTLRSAAAHGFSWHAATVPASLRELRGLLALPVPLEADESTSASVARAHHGCERRVSQLLTQADADFHSVVDRAVRLRGMLATGGTHADLTPNEVKQAGGFVDSATYVLAQQRTVAAGTSWHVRAMEAVAIAASVDITDSHASRSVDDTCGRVSRADALVECISVATAAVESAAALLQRGRELIMGAARTLVVQPPSANDSESNTNAFVNNKASVDVVAEAVVAGVLSGMKPESDEGQLSDLLVSALRAHLSELDAITVRLSDAVHSARVARDALAAIASDVHTDTEALRVVAGSDENRDIKPFLRNPRAMDLAEVAARAASENLVVVVEAELQRVSDAESHTSVVRPILLSSYERGVLEQLRDDMASAMQSTMQRAITEVVDDSAAPTTAQQTTSTTGHEIAVCLDGVVSELLLATQELVVTNEISTITNTPRHLWGIDDGDIEHPNNDVVNDAAAPVVRALVIPQDRAAVRTLLRLRVPRIALAARNLVLQARRAQVCLPQHVASLLNGWHAMCVQLYSEYIELHAASAAYTVCLAVILSNFVREGLCSPVSAKGAGDDDGTSQVGGASGAPAPDSNDVKDGTGMGIGQGERDVSDEITNEEQVLGNKADEANAASNPNDVGAQPMPPQPRAGGKDDAIEMNDDFAGEMEDAPEDGGAEHGDDDNDEHANTDKEADRCFGEIEASDPLARTIDESMWDDKSSNDNDVEAADDSIPDAGDVRSDAVQQPPLASGKSSSHPGRKDKGRAASASGSVSAGAQDDNQDTTNEASDGGDSESDEVAPASQPGDVKDVVDNDSDVNEDSGAGGDHNNATERGDSNDVSNSDVEDEGAQNDGAKSSPNAVPMPSGEHSRRGSEALSHDPERDALLAEGYNDAMSSDAEGSSSNAADAADRLSTSDLIMENDMNLEDNADNGNTIDSSDSGSNDLNVGGSSTEDVDMAGEVKPDGAPDYNNPIATLLPEDMGAQRNVADTFGVGINGESASAAAAGSQGRGHSGPRGSKQQHQFTPAEASTRSAAEVDGDSQEGNTEASKADGELAGADNVDVSDLLDPGPAPSADRAPQQQQTAAPRRAEDSNPFLDPASAMRRWQARLVQRNASDPPLIRNAAEHHTATATQHDDVTLQENDDIENDADASRESNRHEAQDGLNGDDAAAASGAGRAGGGGGSERSPPQPSGANDLTGVSVHQQGGQAMLLPVIECVTTTAALAAEDDLKCDSGAHGGDGNDASDANHNTEVQQLVAATADTANGVSTASHTKPEQVDRVRDTVQPIDTDTANTTTADNTLARDMIASLATASSASSSSRSSIQQPARNVITRDHDRNSNAGSADNAAVTAAALAPSTDVAKLRAEFEVSLMQLTTTPVGVESLELASRAWAALSTLTTDAAARLCEGLRLILEPTLAAKLGGEFRTGKRINMRRVIPYIASQFRKDKIWMRRATPSKRTYQVLLAVDDSRSMAPGNTGGGPLACEAVALLCRALSRLDVGQIALASFGDRLHLLHPFDVPWSDEAGARSLAQFTFAQGTTATAATLEAVVGLLAEARAGTSSTSSGALQTTCLQIVFLISDGMLGSGAERDRTRSWVAEATARGQLVVLVIVDRLRVASTAMDSGSAATTTASTADESIVNMQSIRFEGGRVIRSAYLDDYPFPYYIVVRDVHEMPEILSDALRQFFELASSVGGMDM